MISVIIPAHDEAAQLPAVLGAVFGSQTVGEVIVVADACGDETAQIARDSGAAVIEIDSADKGTAMSTGIDASDGDLVLFIDGDLVGLTAAHVDAMSTAPPLAGQLVGLTDGNYPGPWPPIAGQRRLPTAFARTLSLVGTGYRAELIIDAAVGRAGLPHREVELRGVGNPSRVTSDPTGWALMWLDLAGELVVGARGLLAYSLHPAGKSSV